MHDNCSERKILEDAERIIYYAHEHSQNNRRANRTVSVGVGAAVLGLSEHFIEHNTDQGLLLTALGIGAVMIGGLAKGFNDFIHHLSATTIELSKGPDN